MGKCDLGVTRRKMGCGEVWAGDGTITDDEDLVGVVNISSKSTANGRNAD